MKKTLIGVAILLLLSHANAVAGPGDTVFSLHGKLQGRDTGRIVLWHFNERNIEVADTVQLDKGRFAFHGTVNRACEALLWTNLKNRDFDDPSVIRFILQPGELSIYYDLPDGSKPMFSGAGAQAEKDLWDRTNSSLLKEKATDHDSLVRYARMAPDTAAKEGHKKWLAAFNAVYEKLQKADIGYIEKHPRSFLSGYLLSKHVRRLPVDSIEHLYMVLDPEVRSSSLGHDILSYIYPLTDDNEFRKANPLIDAQFDRRLRNIRHVYDLVLKDTLGNVFPWENYRGKFLVVDFWASWCKPCIENIPALEHLRDVYAAAPVAFISISVDRDPNAWKRAIVKQGFAGIQLRDFEGFNSLSAVYCKVLWVPTYLVVGPDGDVVRYDAPQAINPNLKTLLNSLLGGFGTNAVQAPSKQK